MNKHSGNKTVKEWAEVLGLSLPAGYQPNDLTLSYDEAVDVLRRLGAFGDKEALFHPVLQAALAVFPDVSAALDKQIGEGYQYVSFRYERLEAPRPERIEIILRKDYERFVLSQFKGFYSGGYSHVSFGPVGE